MCEDPDISEGGEVCVVVDMVVKDRRGEEAVEGEVTSGDTPDAESEKDAEHCQV